MSHSCDISNSRHVLAGLADNDYEREKCAVFFEAYKQCRQQTVRSSQRARASVTDVIGEKICTLCLYAPGVMPSVSPCVSSLCAASRRA
jgi:hypothetical protein